MSYRLLLGGVRSGKSRLAVELAERQHAPVVVIATAVAFDESMGERIRRHRAERPPSWSTIEEPERVVERIGEVDPSAFVLLDCATVWAANLMLGEMADAEIIERSEALAETLAGRSGHGVVVTNEVGMGVHPSSELGRRYRDVLGAVNVRLASRAERSALIVAGRAMLLDDPIALLG
ncbi:MAG: bifunctional adenosylcobinamide kinase/adenosylcobinamide-phosphate guanylyltransferase [Ilumatobacteraceae bacterium]